VEAHVAGELGLDVEPVSTQIIPRDRHAMFFATLGVIALVDRAAGHRDPHLQRTEVLEAEEYFSPGQKGSSAMPHKRNPVLTENLTGLARMVRGYVTRRWRMSRFGMSGTSRTRRSSGSSARRDITLDFALARLTGVIDKLVVYPSGCGRTSTAWAGSSTRSACCSH
jgi:adenylosuccinate lyase